ncbi:MAG: hypothetical protein M1594_01775 [Candidatus Marsarchaeota archaeon]|nr:hypothetical protein [Candidatus Marsarchaeota archaeon]
MNKKITIIAGCFSVILLAGSFVYFLSNEWFFTDPLTEALALLVPLIVVFFFIFILIRNVKKHR